MGMDHNLIGIINSLSFSNNLCDKILNNKNINEGISDEYRKFLLKWNHIESIEKRECKNIDKESNTILLPPVTKEENSSVIPAEGSPQKYSINDVVYKILNEFFKDYTDKIHPDFLIPIVRESIPASKSIDPNQKLLGPEVVNEVINAFKNSEYAKEIKDKMDNLIKLYNEIYNIIEESIENEIYKEMKQ